MAEHGRRPSWPAGSRSCRPPTSRPRWTTPGVEGDEADAIVEENEKARIAGLRVSLAVLALIAVLALFFTRGIPTVPVGHDPSSLPAMA